MPIVDTPCSRLESNPSGASIGNISPSICYEEWTLVDSEFSVGVNILLIPDGLTTAGDLRLSLSITPNVRPPAGMRTVDIREWPHAIRDTFKTLRVLVGTVSQNASGFTVQNPVCLPDILAPDIDVSPFAADADALYKRLFVPDGSNVDDAFRLLLASLREGTDSVVPKLEAKIERRLGTYSVSGMSAVMDAVRSASFATNLIDRCAYLARGEDAAGASAFARSGVPEPEFWKELVGSWFGVDWRYLSLGAYSANPWRQRLGHPEGAPGEERLKVVADMRVAAQRYAGIHKDGAVLESDAAIRVALGQVADALRGQVDSKTFWSRGIASVDVADRNRLGSPALRKEIFRFQECWNLGWKPLNTVAPTAPPLEAPRRKLGGILAFPTLAKFLSFVVDLQIPLDEVLNPLRTANLNGADGRLYGALAAVRVDSANPEPCPVASDPNLIWTAVVYRPPGQVPMYFGPCMATEAASLKPDLKQPFREGVVDLGLRIDNTNVPRFELVTLDSTGAWISWAKRAETVAIAVGNGLSSANITTSLPAQRARGLELIDNSARTAAIESMDRERKAHEMIKLTSTVQLVGVDGLALGYRVDAAIVDKGGTWRLKERWRSLTERDVHYRARLSDGHVHYRDIPETYLKNPIVMMQSGRDSGHSRMMTGNDTVVPSAPDTPIVPGDPPQPQPALPKNQLVTHPQVFTWTGESLGGASVGELVPGQSPSEDPRTVWPGAQDLAIDLEFEVPGPPEKDKTDRRPSILREGRSYLVGLRPFLVNGISVSFEDAVQRYITDPSSPALGSAPGMPLEYRRRDTIQAPDVFLEWSDRIVTKSPDKWLSEGLDTLVLRSGPTMSTDQSRRYMAPPRSTFDTSEQGGVFDTDKSAKPAGAFGRSPCGAALEKTTGSFPIARANSWTFPPANGGSSASPQESRGGVFVLLSSPTQPKLEYHPDPLARTFKAAFCHLIDGTPVEADKFGAALKPALTFWDAKAAPSSAKPVILELHKAAPNEGGQLRGWFEKRSVSVNPQDGGGAIDLDATAVKLKPAEVVDIAIWSQPDASEVLSRHELFRDSIALLTSAARTESRGTRARAIGSVLAELSGPNASTAIEKLMEPAALPDLQNATFVRVVHAVEKPIDPPKFIFTPVEGGPQTRLNFHPVLLTVAPAAVSSATGRKSWAQFVKDHEQSDPLDWPSEAGGATAFFVGSLQVHRPSSDRLRVEAAWSEYGPESEHFDPKTKTWSIKPSPQTALLFDVSHIPADDANRDKAIDLLKDDTAALRALAHSFVDPRARHLNLRAVSGSRFSGFFPPPPNADLSRFELPSGDFGALNATLWLPATVAPKAPDIDRLSPLFRWTSSGNITDGEISFQRKSSTRVYLERPWHTSGEGELLGLVCWPPNLLNQDAAEENAAASAAVRLTVCDLDNQLGKGGRFVTRWGADPTRLSGQLDDLISADRFSDYSVKAHDLNLSFHSEPTSMRPGNRDVSSIKVSVLGYKPKLDPNEGLWFADVTIDHGAAYYPFVQLSMARYQPNAIENYELSEPVTRTVQIPAQRDGRITRQGYKELILELHGVGYRRTNTGGHDTDEPLTDVPLLSWHLMKAVAEDNVPSDSSGGVRWERVLDRAGKPVEQLRLRPIQKGAEVWWVSTIQLPEVYYLEDYGLLIEEFEMVARDQPCGTGPGDIKFTTVIEERGPMFAHLLDLRSPFRRQNAHRKLATKEEAITDHLEGQKSPKKPSP
jgi:hypothetical protein